MRMLTEEYGDVGMLPGMSMSSSSSNGIWAKLRESLKADVELTLSSPPLTDLIVGVAIYNQFLSI